MVGMVAMPARACRSALVCPAGTAQCSRTERVLKQKENNVCRRVNDARKMRERCVKDGIVVMRESYLSQTWVKDELNRV